jgi:hypothetical protein
VDGVPANEHPERAAFERHGFALRRDLLSIVRKAPRDEGARHPAWVSAQLPEDP